MKNTKLVPIMIEDLKLVPMGSKMKYKQYDFLKQKEVLYKGGFLKKINQDSIILEDKNGYKKQIPYLQFFQGKPFYKTFFYQVVKIEKEQKGSGKIKYEEVPINNSVEEKPKEVDILNEEKMKKVMEKNEFDLQKMIDEQEMFINHQNKNIKKLINKIKQDQIEGV